VILVGAIALAVFVLPPVWGLAAVTLGIAVEVAEVGFWIRFLRRYRIATGKEALIGASAEVIEACDPRGRVRFRGEIWHAECGSWADVGDRVKVIEVHGLTLRVEAENGKGPH
jgi:membrane protein implicated in regulation of membrane protease activity